MNRDNICRIPYRCTVTEDCEKEICQQKVNLICIFLISLKCHSIHPCRSHLCVWWLGNKVALISKLVTIREWLCRIWHLMEMRRDTEGWGNLLNCVTRRSLRTLNTKWLSKCHVDVFRVWWREIWLMADVELRLGSFLSTAVCWIPEWTALRNYVVRLEHRQTVWILKNLSLQHFWEQLADYIESKM
jgi:hypothetical protein